MTTKSANPNNSLKLHYDTKPSHFNRRKKFLPNVIYVDVLPNQIITAKDVYHMLLVHTSAHIFFIDDKIFNHKKLLEKQFIRIQNHLCCTSAQVYIINSPLLIYDLYHKMNPDETYYNKKHFEEIRLFKTKAQHHFLIDIIPEGTTARVASKKNIDMQEKIHQICSRFVHVTPIRITEKYCNLKKTLLSKLSVN